jgi:hypothetical protein
MYAIASEEVGIILILGNLGAIIGGSLLVAAGQLAQAIVDIADSNQEILQVLREHSVKRTL